VAVIGSIKRTLRGPSKQETLKTSRYCLSHRLWGAAMGGGLDVKRRDLIIILTIRVEDQGGRLRGGKNWASSGG